MKKHLNAYEYLSRDIHLAYQKVFLHKMTHFTSTQHYPTFVKVQNTSDLSALGEAEPVKSCYYESATLNLLMFQCNS